MLIIVDQRLIYIDIIYIKTKIKYKYESNNYLYLSDKINIFTRL